METVLSTKASDLVLYGSEMGIVSKNQAKKIPNYHSESNFYFPHLVFGCQWLCSPHSDLDFAQFLNVPII